MKYPEIKPKITIIQAICSHFYAISIRFRITGPDVVKILVENLPLFRQSLQKRGTFYIIPVKGFFYF